MFRQIAIKSLILLFFTSPSFAATLYLDGSASGCNNGDANYNIAARSCGSGNQTVYTDLRTASNNLASGDHLYIRSGQYYYQGSTLGWNTGSLVIDGTGTVVENYGTEQVWIQTGDDHTDIQSNDLNNPVLIDGTNTVLRGNGFNLKIWGCLLVSGTNVTVEGCDLSGGWDHQSSIGGDAWYDVIRFEFSTDAKVRNCKIHDNYNHGTATASANKSLIMHEKDVNTLVENCDFYNPLTQFVYAKYQPSGGTVHTTYRKNWFKGGFGFDGPNHEQSKQLIVTQNVFTNGAAGGYFYKDGLHSRLFKVYNNTFYNCSAGLYSWSGGALDAHEWFNNIFYVTSGTRYGVDFNEVGGSLSGAYLDYNDYCAAGGTIAFRHNYQTYTMANWASHLGSGESHSIAADPAFAADDGKVDGSSPGDFKRSYYPTNGRGGSWPLVMGAYITGSEVIGTQSGGQSSPPPTNPPQTPGTPVNTQVIP